MKARLFPIAIMLFWLQGAGAHVVISIPDYYGAFDRCQGQRWLNANPALRQRIRLISASQPALRDELQRIAEGVAYVDAAQTSADAAATAADAAAGTLSDAEPDPQTEAAVTQLRRFLGDHGFPVATIVGADGMQALWRVVESAGFDRTFQLRVAEYLLGLDRQERGLVSGREPARLVDTILLEQGEPQRYGTLYERRGDVILRRPSDSEPQLEARRQAAGLLPARIELCMRRDINEVDGFLPW